MLVFLLSLFAEQKIIGYWQPRENGIQAKDIDASRITHLLYAFANINANGTVSLAGPATDAMNWDAWATTANLGDNCSCGSAGGSCLAGHFNEVWKLKSKNPSLKTVLSIGGWSWSLQFSAAFSDPTKRQIAIQSATALMVTYGFDGIDIDWEFPATTSRASSDPGYTTNPQDFSFLAQFCQEIRSYWASQSLSTDTVLSVAMPPQLQDSPGVTATVASQLNQYCTFIMIMSYEFQHNDLITRLGAPLYGTQQDSQDERTKNIDGGIKEYINLGVSKDKIIMGIPLYAVGFSGFSTISGGRDMPCLGNALTNKNTIVPVDYKSILSDMDNKQYGYPQYTFSQSRAQSSICNGTDFYSFDTPESVKVKAQYALQNSLGGLMIWDLSQDATDSMSIMSAIASVYKVQQQARTFQDICLKQSNFCNLRCNYTPLSTNATFNTTRPTLNNTTASASNITAVSPVNNTMLATTPTPVLSNSVSSSISTPTFNASSSSHATPISITNSPTSNSSVVSVSALNANPIPNNKITTATHKSYNRTRRYKNRDTNLISFGTAASLKPIFFILMFSIN